MRTLALTVLMLCASAAAASQTWVLTRAEWAGPLNAQRVIALAPVRSAVHALDAASGSRILVAHNGGEEGLFWASNLEGWLVALGVPAARIVDRSAGVPPNEIHLELLPPAAGAP
ncbi:MAG: hypothetical protein ACRER1_04830 [Gammaproteobacteria bacterium]